MAGVKSPKFWEGGELLSGPGFREAGQLHGGALGSQGKRLNRGRGGGAVNRPLLRPKVWEEIIRNTAIQKASSLSGHSVPLVHYPKKSGSLH